MSGATVDDAREPADRGAARLPGSAAPSGRSPLLAWMPASAAAALSRVFAAIADRLLRTPRARLAAGVFVAIVLGSIPAGIVGSRQETSAFRAIDAQVVAVQAAVDSTQSYDTLDAFRADQLAAKRSARRRAVITSMLVWTAVSGGIAYAWWFGRRSRSRPRWSRSTDTP
jgi:hypothetical protein